jgi:hypothetical protein
MTNTRECNRRVLWAFHKCVTSHGHPWDQLLNARIRNNEVTWLDTIVVTDELCEAKMLLLGALYPELVDFQDIFSVCTLRNDEVYFRFQLQRLFQWFLKELCEFDTEKITGPQEEHLAQHLGEHWQLEDSFNGESIRILLGRKRFDTLWMGRPEDMQLPEFFFEIIWVVLNGDARGIPVSSAKEAFEYWILQLGGSDAEGYIEQGGGPVRITAAAETKEEESECVAMRT